MKNTRIRGDGAIVMFTATFEATVQLTPAKRMCLLLIKNLTSSNIAIELLSKLSKIVSIPVHELGTSSGKSHNWKSYSINPEYGSPTSNRSMSDKSILSSTIHAKFTFRSFIFWKWVMFFAACFLSSYFLIHARFLHCRVANSTTSKQADLRSSTFARVRLRAGRTVMYDFRSKRTFSCTPAYCAVLTRTVLCRPETSFRPAYC